MMLPKSKLAIEGGAKAKTTPNIPMYPGGMNFIPERSTIHQY